MTTSSKPASKPAKKSAPKSAPKSSAKPAGKSAPKSHAKPASTATAEAAPPKAAVKPKAKAKPAPKAAPKSTEPKRVNDQINFSSRKKQSQDFSHKDLRRSNCYSTDFSGSNFSHASFRGAQFKTCNFFVCTFTATEFVAANLKNSRFVEAKFKDVVFDSATLTGANFERASFDNVIFVATDTSTAKNLDLSHPGIRVFNSYPEVEISEELERAIRIAMRNEYIKYARVLDTKTGAISSLSIMILLEHFTEEELIAGLTLLKTDITADFGTLSHLIAALNDYKANGAI